MYIHIVQTECEYDDYTCLVFPGMQGISNSDDGSDTETW
jgi:hypothetical protein